MPSVFFTEEDDPSNPGKTTVAIRFPFDALIKDQIKGMGWWWNPAPALSWYIPTKRLAARRQRRELVLRTLAFFQGRTWTVVDNQNILPAWRAEIANGGAATSGAVDPLRAQIESWADLPVSQEPRPTPQAATPQTTRPAVTRPNNLNRQVQQRVNEQRRQAEAREERIREQERRDRNREQHRQAPPAQRVWTAHAGPFAMTWKRDHECLTIKHNGNTLELRANEFEQLMKQLECPLKNEFNKELVGLWQERGRYLLAFDIREQTYAQLAAGEVTEKEAYIRFAFWRDVDFSKMAGVLEEFEVLSTALGEGGIKALRHSVKGCHTCRGR